MRSLRSFIITIVLCVCVLGYIVYNYVGDALLYKLDPDKPKETVQNAVTEADPDATQAPGVVAPLPQNPGNVGVGELQGITEATFLFVGTDFQPSVFDYKESGYNDDGVYEKQRKVSADAMLLVKIDKAKQTFMFSYIPVNAVLNKSTNKTVADFYTEKGADYMIECVYALTGIRAEHLAVIGVEDCVKALKEIGNVTYNVPCDMKAKDEWQNYEIDLSAGVQTLNPNQIVSMLRFKDYPADSKLSREALLVDFAQALFSKLTAPSYFGTAASLFSKAIGCFETKFTLSDFTDHLDLIFSYQKYTVKVITIPGMEKTVNDEVLFMPSTKESFALFSEYK